MDQDVAFAAIDALGAVVPTYAADAGRSNRLVIDDASTRLRVAPDTGTELLAERSVQVLPGTVHAPPPEILTNSLPSMELVWEQPPGTATPRHVEDGVQDLADRVRLGRPMPLGGGRSGSRRANSASVRSVRYGRREVRHRPSYRENRPGFETVFSGTCTRNYKKLSD
jgi:hypothetical protein